MNRKNAAILLGGIVAVLGFVVVQRSLRPGDEAGPESGDEARSAAGLDGNPAMTSVRHPGDVVAGTAANSANRRALSLPAKGLKPIQAGRADTNNSVPGMSTSRPRGSAQPGAQAPIRGAMNGADIARISLSGIERIRKDFASFFDATRLGRDVRDRFVGIRVEELLSFEDILDLSRRAGLSNEQEFQLLEKNRLEADARVSELIGPENMAAYRDYRLSLAYRPLIQTAADLCVANGVEMPPATVEALALALVKNKARPSGRPEGMVYTEQQYAITLALDKKAVEVARGVLTPAQLEFFKQTLAERAARAKPPQ
jgi:hypothetical protein